MREKPILFSGEMVRAILDGRKTMTRRVVKPQPQPPGPSHWYFHEPEGWWTCGNNSGDTWKCPFGTAGDRLWVRETWSPWADPETRTAMRTTDQCIWRADYKDGVSAEEVGGDRWRSPIHMPRWASRITLEIADVRLERLQDISEEDAKAEGLIEWQKADSANLQVKRYGISVADVWEKDPRKAFERLWDKINGKKYPWSSNPFVWVLEFRKL